jgi:hypothetical protein
MAAIAATAQPFYKNIEEMTITRSGRIHGS